jgi:hypothetical protein
MPDELDALLARADAAIACAWGLVERSAELQISLRRQVTQFSIRAKFLPKAERVYSPQYLPKQARPPYQPLRLGERENWPVPPEAVERCR